MAIIVDWPTKTISIHRTDPEVSNVTGTLYELDTDAFRLTLKNLEDDEAGMVWPRTHKHNTEVTVAGTTYARFVEIVNGYKVQFLPDASWTVRLAGSNNNLFDVENGILVQNSVQVIPGNSAGLITTDTSGLTAIEAVALATVRKLLENKQELVDTGADVRLRTYEDDGTTIFEESIVTDKTDAKPDLAGITKRGVPQ